MAYSITVVLALLAVQITALSTPAINPADIPVKGVALHPKLPYPVVDMVWEGVLSNGENVTVVGGIEKVATELDKLEPGRSTSDPSKLGQRDALEPRVPTGQTCDLPAGYEAVYVNRPFGVRPIEDGIRHLKNVGGGCGVGPNTCVRVSCSYDTAVFLCNNNGFAIAPSCHYLGSEHLQWLNDNCERWGIECCPTSWVEINGGIRFDSENYTLWLIEDEC